MHPKKSIRWINTFNMQSAASTVNEYINSLPADRGEVIRNIRKVILKNLPEGFAEGIQYGMIGYFVPHKLYPNGYHSDPSQPLPFIGLASQKNFIALYHMGLYADKRLLTWFNAEYLKHSKKNPDMGKSCIRFKKPGEIPLDLIGQLASKVTVDDWVSLYESNLKK